MMKYIADLHTHSTASDGQHAPSKLIKLAKETGIEVLALTDHDTVDGLEEATRSGAAVNLKVIRGVELGAKEHRNLHILGYGFSEEAPALRALCEQARRDRDERKYRILDFLKGKGIILDLAEVEAQAGGKVLGRPHFAQVMVKHGFVANSREAFDRYLDTEEYDRIKRAKVDARTCVETIKADGGKVSLAHPYQLGYSEEALRQLVRTLKDYGLDAIECHYPKYTREQAALYLRLAREFDLHITGGSDFHGEKVKPDVNLAKVELKLDWLL